MALSGRGFSRAVKRSAGRLQPLRYALRAQPESTFGTPSRFCSAEVSAVWRLCGFCACPAIAFSHFGFEAPCLQPRSLIPFAVDHCHSPLIFPRSLQIACLAPALRATTGRCHTNNSSRQLAASPSRRGFIPRNSQNGTEAIIRRSCQLVTRHSSLDTAFLIATPRN